MTTPTKAWPPVNAHKIEGTEAHAHPSHAIRAYTAATNEDVFSTRDAARSTTPVLPALHACAFLSYQPWTRSFLRPYRRGFSRLTPVDKLCLPFQCKFTCLSSQSR